MIRDTSHQDTVVAAPPGQKFKRRAMLAGGVVLLAVISALLLKSWGDSEHAVSASRLRIAEVGRGTWCATPPSTAAWSPPSARPCSRPRPPPST
ncbi:MULTISPECIES: hypothetical protein [unclassified Massilia]|uniref:hypothetical protein n=1 Tax=unclassified Massilia TaxID=2609279 RepID=UPI001E363DFF|nr:MULTISPECIES: hypothetical protein [unclassified Massilia]